MGAFGLYFRNGDVEQLAERLHEATIIDWKAKSEEAFTIARRFDRSQIVAQWKEVITSA